MHQFRTILTTSQRYFGCISLIARLMGLTRGPPGVLSAPGGPHVSPMNFAIWDMISKHSARLTPLLELVQLWIWLYIYIYTYIYVYIYISLICWCPGTTKWFRSERRQDSFHRWDKDSHLGVVSDTRSQHTEYPLTNQLGFLGSSL